MSTEPDPDALHDGDHEATAARYGLDVDVVAGLRRWSVATGVVRRADEVLLVRNRRRNGSADWSTPGGVIDLGEQPTVALTREVREETGLAVAAWSGPIYEVELVAPDAGFHLRVVAHLADGAPSGVLGDFDDPDGIVEVAEYCTPDDAALRLGEGPPWVSEPLLAHLVDGVADGRRFGFLLDGAHLATARLSRHP